MKKTWKMSGKKKRTIWACVIIWLFVVIMVMPFVLTLSASFQEEWLISKGDFSLIPRSLTLQNFKDLLVTESQVLSFKSNLISSFKVSLGTGLVALVVAVMGAYALSHFKFPGAGLISKAMLFLYVFPTILMISPIYGLLVSLKLVDTHIGLILVHASLVSPFCIWLLKSFFDSIPHEVEEAALIDGASRWQVIRRIIIPLAAPGILTVAIYAMIYSWGEYTFSSILINTTTKKTIPLALSGFISMHDLQWGRLLAGCTLNFVPLFCIFMPFIKNFLKGFTAGAVKQ